MLSWIHFAPFRDDLDGVVVAAPGEKRTKFRCGFSGLSEPGYTKPILVVSSRVGKYPNETAES
jgi:hypothetical protein